MAMPGSNRATASLSATLLARKGTARPAMRTQGYGGFGAPGSPDDLGWNDIAGEAASDHPDTDIVTPLDGLDPAPGDGSRIMPSVLKLRHALHARLELAPAERASADVLVDRAESPDDVRSSDVESSDDAPSSDVEPSAESPDDVPSSDAQMVNGNVLAAAGLTVETPAANPGAAHPGAVHALAVLAAEPPAAAAAALLARRAFTLRLDAERHLRLRLASAILGTSAQKLVIEALDAFLHALPDVDDVARSLPRHGAVARDPEGDVR